jgi:hypothetical protein
MITREGRSDHCRELSGSLAIRCGMQHAGTTEGGQTVGCSSCGSQLSPGGGSTEMISNRRSDANGKVLVKRIGEHPLPTTQAWGLWRPGPPVAAPSPGNRHIDLFCDLIPGQALVTQLQDLLRGSRMPEAPPRRKRSILTYAVGSPRRPGLTARWWRFCRLRLWPTVWERHVYLLLRSRRRRWSIYWVSSCRSDGAGAVVRPRVFGHDANRNQSITSCGYNGSPSRQ